MLDSYLPLAVLFVLTGGFLCLLLAISIGLGPKRYSEVKDEPFECGTVGSGDARGRHGVRFYLVAVSFIVFDVELVFFYPWAVNAKELGVYGLWAILPFFIILAIGLLYECKKGVLDLY